MNPYNNFVSEFARLVQEGKSNPLGGFPPAGKRPEARGHKEPINDRRLEAQNGFTMFSE